MSWGYTLQCHNVRVINTILFSINYKRFNSEIVVNLELMQKEIQKSFTNLTAHYLADYHNFIVY